MFLVQRNEQNINTVITFIHSKFLAAVAITVLYSVLKRDAYNKDSSAL
jgi:hypothetical protein